MSYSEALCVSLDIVRRPLLTASMLTAGSVAAGQRIDGPASFRVFLQGRLVGAEDVIVRRSGTEVIISGTGRLGAPLDFTTRRIEIRYDQEWRPQSLALEASTKGGTLGIQTTFANGQAENEVNQTGVVKRKTDTVTADTIVLPSLFFGSYEALALRLASIPDGGTFKVYVAPQAEIPVKQTGRSSSAHRDGRPRRRRADLRADFSESRRARRRDRLDRRSRAAAALRGRRAIAAGGARRSRLGRLAHAGHEPRRRPAGHRPRRTASTSPGR